MTDFRTELAQLMNSTLADEATNHTWTYHAVRPCPVPPTWKPLQQVWGDCSKGVQFLCEWAGCKDPMGQGYNAYGNSYTLWSHLQHLDAPAELLIGDIVTFGPDGDEHAAMVLGAGPDPLLWSFGHQGAPDAYRLSEDSRPSQYLRNPLPVYVPTAEDKLRARNDWFAWVAWRLGEGDWRPYGRTDAKVRPDVPKVIPSSWWKRLGKFIANRDKGNPVGKA